MTPHGNSCGVLKYAYIPEKSVQHKLLLPFLSKKVIAKIEGGNRSESGHGLSSKSGYCGHYSTSGGKMQEGREEILQKTNDTRSIGQKVCYNEKNSQEAASWTT